MNNQLGEAMLATYAELGVQIDRFDNTDAGVILYFSVPFSSWHLNTERQEMAGPVLAKRVKETLQGMGVVFATCKYKIRNEHWTEDKSKEARRIAYKDMGYKDWQMKGMF